MRMSRWELYKQGRRPWRPTAGRPGGRRGQEHDHRLALDGRHNEPGDGRSASHRMLQVIGFCGNVTTMLDEVAGVPGSGGVILCFDDIVGIEQFGEHIQPLMRNRADVRKVS